MKFESRFTIPVAMLALTLGSAPLMAQQPTPAPGMAGQASKAEAKSAQGELLKVDMDKKLVQIKSADNKEMQFHFTDATEVTGESRNVEGLATKTGTKVTVEYEGQGTNMVATKIAIQPSASSASPSPSTTRPSTPAPSPAPATPSPSPSTPAPQPAPRP